MMFGVYCFDWLFVLRLLGLVVVLIAGDLVCFKVCVCFVFVWYLYVVCLIWVCLCLRIVVCLIGVCWLV